jgi:alkylation response protein AidB-like acyl-CoA dehydrogenase
MARMMELTNGARLGIGMMGLGCARRALVESLCYARAREAFGSELVNHPLMQRKLAELIVEVEAAQALVFDGYLGPRLRLGAPLIKLRAARSASPPPAMPSRSTAATATSSSGRWPGSSAMPR